VKLFALAEDAEDGVIINLNDLPAADADELLGLINDVAADNGQVWGSRDVWRRRVGRGGRHRGRRWVKSWCPATPRTDSACPKP
jgi:hypothetical protein